jgi:hypothetical protein
MDPTKVGLFTNFYLCKSVDILVSGLGSLTSSILYDMGPDLQIRFRKNEPVLELQLSGYIFSENKSGKIVNMSGYRYVFLYKLRLLRFSEQ